MCSSDLAAAWRLATLLAEADVREADVREDEDRPAEPFGIPVPFTRRYRGWCYLFGTFQLSVSSQHDAQRKCRMQTWQVNSPSIFYRRVELSERTKNMDVIQREFLEQKENIRIASQSCQVLVRVLAV